MGPERKSRVISQKEKEITAYHEGGHALVAASVKDADPVQKVSIISRGFAGGYTMKIPNEDQHLKTRNQFLADLAMMMGGYVSEKLPSATSLPARRATLKKRRSSRGAWYKIWHERSRPASSSERARR